MDTTIHKLLFLGPGSSGKTTLSQQFSHLYNQSITSEELTQRLSILATNVLDYGHAMATVLSKHSTEQSITLSQTVKKSLSYFLDDEPNLSQEGGEGGDGGEDMESAPASYAKALKAGTTSNLTLGDKQCEMINELWKHEIIQKLWLNERHLFGSGSKDNLAKVVANAQLFKNEKGTSHQIPTVDNFLLSSIATTGE